VKKADRVRERQQLQEVTSRGRDTSMRLEEEKKNQKSTAIKEVGNGGTAAVEESIRRRYQFPTRLRNPEPPLQEENTLTGAENEDRYGPRQKSKRGKKKGKERAG